MRRTIIITTVVLLVLAVGTGLYFYYRSVQGQSSGQITSVPTGQRSSVGSDVNLSADVTSEYRDIDIKLTDKTILSTYLNQYDFWNKDIPYYNSLNKALIGKFRPNAISFVLSKSTDAKYPFVVADLGSFNDFYDIHEQPGPIVINIFIDPTAISTMSEDDLAKRFSTVALSAVNFLTQANDPNTPVALVEPPASFVTVTKAIETPSPNAMTPEQINSIPEIQ